MIISDHFSTSPPIRICHVRSTRNIWQEKQSGKVRFVYHIPKTKKRSPHARQSRHHARGVSTKSSQPAGATCVYIQTQTQHPPRKTNHGVVAEGWRDAFKYVKLYTYQRVYVHVSIHLKCAMWVCIQTRQAPTWNHSHRGSRGVDGINMCRRRGVERLV